MSMIMFSKRWVDYGYYLSFDVTLCFTLELIARLGTQLYILLHVMTNKFSLDQYYVGQSFCRLP